MNNTSSNLTQIKHMVIATSLTTAVLGSFIYEPSLSNMNAINYQPIGSGHSWDIGSLKSYTPNLNTATAIPTDEVHVQELLIFASVLTNNSIDIDPEIRQSIEKNFWDMI
jgi:hypothetical protein